MGITGGTGKKMGLKLGNGNLNMTENGREWD